MRKDETLTFNSFEELLNEYAANSENMNNLISTSLSSTLQCNSTREADDNNEKDFDAFLCSTIYPEFINKGVAVSITPATDIQLQCAGCDAVWQQNNINILVDNKNRTSVMNRRSRAIPFELATDDKCGERIPGWFMDDSKETDYICSFHCFTDDKRQHSFNDITCNDISYMDIFFVKPDDIMGYLMTAANIDKTFLSELATTVEENFCSEVIGASVESVPNDMRKLNLCAGATIHTSMFSLKENPTVLLMDESIVKLLPSTRHFHWTRNYGLNEVIDKAYRPALTPRNISKTEKNEEIA